ncbi:hypothetical protein [Algoriphagus hitonicola]|uniref:Glycosyltransferase family 10 (Fucosyltransferase) C-term n=1 Tax=Algoriphagus hitonicola TaxID=435880 RepID=A0A1I2TGM9_9BACT|nr:hypothetical protein [Algoriphagus hitonicola]SFG64062.1 hypothetical protein SAMN04487988_10620 [Algoriphagus hitonicola]
MSKIKVKIQRKIWKLNKFLFSILFILKSYFRSYSAPIFGRSVYVNLANAQYYQRYYYIYVKYFLIEGYTVFLKNDLIRIYDLSIDTDSSFIFQENNVYWGVKKKIKCLEFNDLNISPDYFNFLKNRINDSSEYYIPIGQHPYAYFKGYWNDQVDLGNNRNHSLFFAGNFNSHVYDRVENKRLFNVFTRLDIKEYLKSKEFYLNFKSQIEVENLLNSNIENKVILVERQGGNGIAPEKMRLFLSYFDFFFALPGYKMPLCHNIVEAMSVGTIPFLEEGYAKVMRPALISGVNCITFHDFNDLDLKIYYLFSLSKEEVNSIRINVLKYYEENLTPRAIVERLTSKKYSSFKLMSVGKSVKYLMNEKE